MHSVSVAGIVRRSNGDVLIIKRADTGDWQIPGGILEPSETVLEGLVRELREETGALVEPLRLTGIYHNRVRGVVALVFLCRPAQSAASETTDEATRVSWVDPEMVETMMTEAFAVRVRDATSGDLIPVIREHDGVHILP